MSLGLSNPIVRVNGETISILTNSLSVNSGKPERKVRSLANGNQIEVVRTQDLETAIGMVKFMLPNTAVALDRAVQWADQSETTDGNTVEIIYPNGGYSFSFREMSMTNSPERSFAAEGEIEIEFMGPPATESLSAT